MKKMFVSIAMCTAVLLGMNACQKETAETVVPGSGHDGAVCKIDYSATLEQPEKSGQAVSKTYLGGEDYNLVYWCAGNQAQGIDADKIVLLGVGGGTGEARHHDILTVKSVNEGDKRSAIFELSENPQVELGELACAVYPSNCVDYDNTFLTTKADGQTGSLEGVISGTVAINFPATQTYVENSFGNGANIAVGKEVKTLNPGKTAGRSDIQFRNAFGVLELHLNGNFKVGKIKVTGHNGEKLNGKFSVNLDNIDNPTAFEGAVATQDRTDGDDVITLDCTANGGVQLNMETATTFDIVVPVNAFKDVVPGDNVDAGGFSAIVYDATGNHTFDVVATVKDNTIHRSKIKAMPGLTVSPAYQKAEYVKSPKDQNPYIDTGYEPKSTDCTEGRMQWDDNVLPQHSFYGVNPLIAFTSWYDNAHPIYRQRWNGTDNVVDIELGNRADEVIIKQDVNKFYFNGELKKEFTNSSWSADEDRTALLFARRAETGGVEECVTSGRIYYFTIKNSGVWIRNYVPCYVVSGQTGKDEKGKDAAAGSIGMLDIVTGRLYVNRGTGSFAKGPDSSGY